MKSNDAYPDYSYEKITDITAAEIRAMGAKAVAVDLDSTLVEYGSYRVESEMKTWAKGIREADIPVIIITNTYPSRALILAAQLGWLPVIPMAHKPWTFSLFLAAKMLGINVEDIAMVGDQLFTDIAAANSAGALSVKVEPLNEAGIFGRLLQNARRREREYLEHKNNTVEC